MLGKAQLQLTKLLSFPENCVFLHFGVKIQDGGDFRGPIMGFLRSPCKTSYRSSIVTIALKCLVFEKITFFLAFWRQTDKQTKKRTEKQMDSSDALSRSHYRERRLKN